MILKWTSNRNRERERISDLVSPTDLSPNLVGSIGVFIPCVIPSHLFYCSPISPVLLPHLPSPVLLPYILPHPRPYPTPAIPLNRYSSLLCCFQDVSSALIVYTSYIVLLSPSPLSLFFFFFFLLIPEDWFPTSSLKCHQFFQLYCSCRPRTCSLSLSLIVQCSSSFLLSDVSCALVYTEDPATYSILAKHILHNMKQHIQN